MENPTHLGSMKSSTVAMEDPSPGREKTNGAAADIVSAFMV